MKVMRIMFEKKKRFFFFKRCLFWKKYFSQDLFFLFIFFSKISFKCVCFTFKSHLSLIMASGSQLKVKTIKYIILIVLAGCFIINIATISSISFKYVI